MYINQKAMSNPSDNNIFLAKNLRYLRERKGKMSQGKLADDVGATRSAISSYEDGRAEPKLSLLHDIARYFNVTIDQLLRMDLAKMDDEDIQRQHHVKGYATAENLRILAITTDGNNNENVEFVNERAAAGYTKGYSDPEYLKELPKYHLPFLAKGKTYRAFEIVGDSMLPIMPHSIVIGEYQEDFTKVKDGQVCIVVTSDGVVLKKVYNRINATGALLLKSSNILYEPYEVKAEDVREVWPFVAYISRTIPEDQINMSDLKMAVERLEEEMLNLKRRN
jgi:DNA-binding XRE family transcriptional regulator